MATEHIATAETVDEAVELGLVELKVSRDEVVVDVLEEPGKKLFGGRKDAVVRVSLKEEAEEPADEVVTEAKQVASNILADEDEVEAGGEDKFALEDLTDEQIDAIADTGIANLKKLISFLSPGDNTIEEFEGDEGEIILDISGENVGVLIGRHCRTIDALQLFVSAITTKQMNIRYPLSVDVEGYKYRRKKKVIDIARRAADRAKRTGRSVSLKPMPPQERRIVHMALRPISGATTTSEGSGSYRHVVIVPL